MVWEISKALLERAESAEAAQAKELTTASKKFASYSRSPGTRKDADRISSVLTPAVVAAVGDVLVTIYEADIPKDSILRASGEEMSYAVAALLIAAADSSLAASAAGPLDRLNDVVTRMNPSEVEPIHYTATLYPEVDAATRLRATARGVLDAQPETVGEAWARELELGLPDEYWSISIAVPGEHADGYIDASVYCDVANYPGDHTEWNIRIGAMSRNPLGSHRPQATDGGHALGEYERESDDARVAGTVSPATDPADLPRTLAEITAANPGFTFAFDTAKISGSPRGTMNPKHKAKVLAWIRSGSAGHEEH